jgi:hypothetical protein
MRLNMAAWKPLMGVWKSDTIKFMQQELLDEQRWRVGPGPPRNGGMISVAFVVVFLVGIAIGDILFAHESKSMQTRRTTRGP